LSNTEEVKEIMFDLENPSEKACSYFETLNIDCIFKENNDEFYSTNTK
jgi:hypothetical protein